MKKFMVIIEGPMGSGKTTVGEILKKDLKRAAVLSTDKIKWLISDFERGSRDNIIVSKVLQSMIREFFRNGINVVLAQGFWKKEYAEDYIEIAKENNIEVFFYQLEAPREILLDRISKRGVNKMASGPVPEERIKSNLDNWESNRYELGKVFDTGVLSAEDVAEKIRSDIESFLN